MQSFYPQGVQRSGWRGGCPATLALLAAAVTLIGCTGRQPARDTPPTAPARPVASVEPPAAPLPSLPPREPIPAAPPFAAEDVIRAQRKRILGRQKSLEQIRRVATSIAPLVRDALWAPEQRPLVRALARDAGLTPRAYLEYFAGKQSADLLLESGGDPDARSVANACGVAQFLAGTARRRGLRVDLTASNHLSRQIMVLERDAELITAAPEGWTRAAPYPARQSSGSGEVPPAPEDWGRERWLAHLGAAVQELRARRREVDERFDPVKAIRAQSRYLLELTRQFGGVDWALQAYHGGEAGARRTYSLFLGIEPRTQMASRSLAMGTHLPYAEVYRRVSPRATPAAFSYLFGRSDDHRYYWWKVLAAERALAEFERDPLAVEREWMALKPGYSTDVVWYPEPGPLQFADDDALRAGYRDGVLVHLPSAAVNLGIRTADLATLAPQSTPLFKGLRPEAMGALLRIAHIYRSAGATDLLTAVALTQTTVYRERWLQKFPLPPLPPGTPRDPEYHTTGLVFDLRRPSRDWDRKVLEYSLGRLYDSRRIAWRTEEGGRTYHVVPNPEFREEMRLYYRQQLR